MKFSIRVLSFSVALVAFSATANDSGCKDIEIFRALHSPSSSHAMKFVCKPYDYRDEKTKNAIGAVSIRELSKLIANQEKFKEHRFQETSDKDSGTVTRIIATAEENGRKVRICRTVATDSPACSVFNANQFLHFAQSEFFCGVPADTKNKAEIVDYKDPSILFPQGQIIPIPPLVLGDGAGAAYRNYEKACLEADYAKSKRKNLNKAEKENETRRDAIISACLQATDAFWVEADNAYADKCGVKNVSDAIDEIKAKTENDAREKAQAELDKQNKQKIKDLDPEQREREGKDRKESPAPALNL